MKPLQARVRAERFVRVGRCRAVRSGARTYASFLPDQSFVSAISMFDLRWMRIAVKRISRVAATWMRYYELVRGVGQGPAHVARRLRRRQTILTVITVRDLHARRVGYRRQAVRTVVRERRDTQLGAGCLNQIALTVYLKKRLATASVGDLAHLAAGVAKRCTTAGRIKDIIHLVAAVIGECPSAGLFFESDELPRRIEDSLATVLFQLLPTS